MPWPKRMWRRKWQPTPVLLPGKSHGRRSLVGCSPWGRKESDTTERLHFHFSLSCIGEGYGNPLQYSCLENPRYGGAWWAAIYGVAQSWTQLKRLSSSSKRMWTFTKPYPWLLLAPGLLTILKIDYISWSNSSSKTCVESLLFALSRIDLIFKHTSLCSRLLHQEPSAAGLGLLAPPRSKPLRFRHSGSLQQVVLGNLVNHL